MNKYIITLLLMCSTYASAAMPADGDSTMAGNQAMRVMTFKAVPGTARTYCYRHDHLGSTTLITNESVDVAQRVEYTPTGETFIEQQDTVWTSPYKFNGRSAFRDAFRAKRGKEKLDEETGLYYFGVRYYNPKYVLWLSCDPQSENKLWTSSYSYAKNNPLRFIDPDGNDEWEINGKGVILKNIKTDKHDAIFLVDASGKRIFGKSIYFLLGSINKVSTQDNAPDISYDVYQIRGDKTAMALFKYFARNTSVEWSLLQTGTAGENGLNFITTSHEEKVEHGMVGLVENKLRYGYTLRKSIHSHPGNTPYPSGLESDKKGDVNNAKWLNRVSKQKPQFLIYLPQKNTFISYGPNSTRAEFDPTMLPEIIVNSTSTRKK